MPITAAIIDAIKVQFKKPIFEDDFVEKGMKAWLVDIEWTDKTGCYELFFDFTEFEAENDKYFKKTFFANKITGPAPTGQLFTAKEAGHYTPKYSVFLSVGPGDQDRRDDEAFAREIQDYLRIVD